MIVIQMLDRYVMLPYTVVCLVVGCLWGVISRTWIQVTPLTILSETDPEVFLLVFMPILIYESAFCMQTHLFKKLTVHMLLIGIVGMGRLERQSDNQSN